LNNDKDYNVLVPQVASQRVGHLFDSWPVAAHPAYQNCGEERYISPLLRYTKQWLECWPFFLIFI
jgi:hypothetical protein